MPDLASVTAVVLVGGLGIRLRSVVTDHPKVLMEIQGRPFLAYLLDQLVDVGIRNAVLCTGYLGEQVRDILGDSYDSLCLVYSQEPSQLGTAGALRLALPLLKSDTVLVMNGDSICKVNLESFLAWHKKRNANASLLLTDVSNTKRYGRVQVDENGLVLRFDEKDGSGGPGLISAGVYFLKRPLILTIPPNKTVSLELEMFPNWIGGGFYGYKCGGRFLDIGTPEAYAGAENFFSLEEMT